MNQVPHPELRKERFEFQNDAGERLAGLLERPDGDVRTHALFAHCFTSSKDIAAASRISRALSGLSITPIICSHGVPIRSM